MGASNVFEAIADDTRRRLLLLLCEREEVAVPDAVLERGPVTSGADDDTDGWEPSRSKQRTEIRLSHVHLPKLVDDGLVEWERGANVVRRGPRFEDVRPVLEVLAENASRVPQEML